MSTVFCGAVQSEKYTVYLKACDIHAAPNRDKTIWNRGGVRGLSVCTSLSAN